MATHSSVLTWRIPGTEGLGGLSSMGSHRVGHDWSDLAAAAAYLLLCSSLDCFQFSSITQSCPTLWDPMNPSMPGLPVHHQLPEITQIHVHQVVMPSSHLILCLPVLFLPPIPRSIRVFYNESTLHMRWPKYWSFNFASVLPKNTQDWSPLGWTGWILQSKGLSRVFSNTTVQKHQFFSAQLSSQSNSHIHTWLLEKPSRVNYSFFTRIWIGFLRNSGHFQHSCWPCGRKQHHMNICI